MAEEIWLLIPEGEGKYEVSNLGNVRNAMTGKILKPRLTRRGYQRVHIFRKDYYIHRLVADAFCEHPEGCDVINHLDNNIQNNRVDNLEWTTQFDNVYHGMRQGHYHFNAVPVIGCKDGKEHFFISAHQAGKETGSDHSAIIKCCRGKAKYTNGYQWRYAGVN